MVGYYFTNINLKQEGNVDPTLKPYFYIFLLIFQHKVKVSLPFEGHNVANSVKVLTKATLCVSMKRL